MDTRPPDANTDIRAVPTGQPDQKDVSAPPVSPWEQYFVGKKVSAQRFVAQLAKGPIPIPDQQVLDRVAIAIAGKPARLARLADLLRAASVSETIRRIAVELVCNSVRRFGLTLLPADADSVAFRNWVVSWLDSIQRRPLPPVELRVLLLLVQMGQQRGLLDYTESIDLIGMAVDKVPKGRSHRPAVSSLSPLDTLLRAAPTGPVLSALVANSRAWQHRTDGFDAQLQSRDQELMRISTSCSNLESDLAQARQEAAALDARRIAAENRIAELEKQILDLGDGWQHKLEQVQGRLRGVMQGQLTRWLCTALDAARSDPPFINAVEERLEDALRVIEGELKWLQHSD